MHDRHSVYATRFARSPGSSASGSFGNLLFAPSMAYLWLQQILALLLPELEDLPAGPEGETQGRAWFERLLARFAERGLSTPAQQKNRVVDARNAIRARFGPDHPSLAYVGFDERTWQEINLPTHDRTEARNENQRLLRSPEKIVARAARLLEGAKFEDLAVGLGITVGRRMSELLDGHAKLEPATAWSVLFTGQRKHKGDREEFCFEIPTLAPAETVLKAWDRLLVMLGDEVLDPQSINNRYGHQVNQAADRHFRGLIPPRLPPAPREGKEGMADDPHGRERSSDALYLHLFRAVYATIAVHWYCPPRVNRLVFKAEIQGHRRVLDAPTRAMRRSYVAARHYDDYQVADASGKNLDGRQGIKLGKWPGLEVLKAFREGTHPEGTNEPSAPPETPRVAPIPVPTEPQAEDAATTPPAPPSPAAVAPPAAAPPTSPDAPMPTEEPPIHTFGTAPAQEDGAPTDGAVPAVPDMPKARKPRPVTYRIYPADRPRLDAFRTDPKQSQAENLQGVIDLLENAGAAIRDQEQVQGQLREATARAEQAEGEREQARQEAQEKTERLAAQGEELQRLQKALEEAQAQMAAAGQAKAGGGSTVALAIVARELLALATEAECPTGLQGRLISLATQALGVNQPTSPEKRQDATTGPARATAAAAVGGQAGQRKAVRNPVDAARYGELFATTGGAGTGGGDGGVNTPATAGAGGQDASTKTAAAAQGTPAGTDRGDANPKVTMAEEATDDDAQEPLETAEVNKGPVVARAFTRRGGAAEKLERALQAVLAHNEAQTGRERKWAVTESALARLTGCFRPAVRGFFAGKAQEIEEHNQRHHLSGGHNAARGKRGETIDGEVRWRGTEEGTHQDQTDEPADGQIA